MTITVVIVATFFLNEDRVPSFNLSFDQLENNTEVMFIQLFEEYISLLCLEEDVWFVCIVNLQENITLPYQSLSRSIFLLLFFAVESMIRIESSLHDIIFELT